MPEADGSGQGGDGNSPANRDTQGSGHNTHGYEMASRQELTAPQIPQRGTEEGWREKARPHRHPDGANGARPKYDALSRRKYGLLAPEEPAGDPYTVEPQGSGDIPKETSETGHRDRRDTGT